MPYTKGIELGRNVPETHKFYDAVESKERDFLYNFAKLEFIVVKLVIVIASNVSG